MSIPRQDDALNSWLTNANQRLAAGGGVYPVAAAQVQAFAERFAAWSAAYEAVRAAVASGVRSKSLFAAKEQAKREMLACAREIYTVVQASGVSDGDKVQLGVVVPKVGRSRRAAPVDRPRVRLVSVLGGTVRVAVLGDGPRGGRPAHCKGFVLMSHVGATPPTRLDRWSFAGTSCGDVVDVTFDPTLPPGTQVYLTATWVNARLEQGPPSSPITTFLSGGVPVLARAA